MSEFWASLGRICVDEGFHKNCFAASSARPNNFQDLQTLRRILCRDNGLRLERGQVWELNHILRWRYRRVETEGREETYVPEEIHNLEDDKELADVRRVWKFDGGSFPADYEMFCVIGLAAMDGQFLKALATDAGDYGSLRHLLTEDGNRSPVFNLQASTIKALQGFIGANHNELTMRQALGQFHATAWVLRVKDEEAYYDDTFFNGCGRSFTYKPKLRSLPEQVISTAVQGHPKFMLDIASLLFTTQGRFTKDELQTLFT